MSRGFYVEGLIFGILRCVATDIKMLRSKFLAKMVSAKFAFVQVQLQHFQRVA